ncbi:hypothetical protein [Ferrovibrio terrae]|uniref:hypothetical protein n=1 Tax=Ferrovibrio terrae TaxID=2594003 RepID=UPI0031379CD5
MTTPADNSAGDSAATVDTAALMDFTPPGNQGGADDTAADQTGDAKIAADKAAADKAADTAGGKHMFKMPDGAEIEVPPELWDAKANDGKGGVNHAAALKRAIDLRQKLGLAGDAAKELVLTVPKEFEGKFEVDLQHPLAQALGEAIKGGAMIPQKTIDALFETFVKGELGRDDFSAKQNEERQADIEAIKADGAKLLKEIGGNAGTVLGELNSWAAATFGTDPETVSELQAMRSSYTGTKILMKMRDLMKGGGGGGGGGVSLTLEDLHKLQESPEYLNGDIEVRRKVEAGYKALYPG